jgi:hypothetical protein
VPTHFSAIHTFSHQGFKAPDQPNNYCEDRLLIAGKTFAVIDGATAVIDVDMNGLNASAYTSQFLAEYLGKFDSEPLTAGDLLLQANTAFGEDLKTNWPEVHAQGKKGPCAAVILLRINGNQATWAQAHDSNLVGRKQDGTWELVSKIDEEMTRWTKEECALRQPYIEQGYDFASVRSVPEVRAQSLAKRARINLDFSDFNGEPEFADHMASGSFNIQDYTDLVLFSDGMDWPEKEGAEALTVAAEKISELGGRAYHDLLQEMYAGDLKGRKYSRLKHMDDATALHLKVQQ